MNPRRLIALLIAVTAATILVVRGAEPAPDDTAAPDTSLTSVATPPPASTGQVATPTTAPAAVTDAEPTGHIDDDSTHQQPPGPTDTGRDAAAAAAVAFARAWTRHTGPDAAGWAARLTALSTPALATKLRAVDPAVVPADTVTGAPHVTASADWADATITTDAGTLQLTLVHTDRWRVNTLDWAPRP